jgi:pyrimidine operon attenuation protein/uracil phosphoribosyltransferase
MSDALPSIDELIARMAQGLAALLQQRGISHPAMVGIHTGGVWVAEQLHRALGIETELGKLDISFYRDDFTRAGMHPQVKPSSLPFAVDDQHIILVDDVLYTGRTIRAAFNELFDYGRPASICLATLIDRDGRELPIQPDVVGAQLALQPHEHIKLKGPHPLSLIRSE